MHYTTKKANQVQEACSVVFLLLNNLARPTSPQERARLLAALPLLLQEHGRQGKLKAVGDSCQQSW